MFKFTIWLVLNLLDIQIKYYFNTLFMISNYSQRPPGAADYAPSSGGLHPATAIGHDPTGRGVQPLMRGLPQQQQPQNRYQNNMPGVPAQSRA